jgi:hypothetical protein
VGFKEDLGLQLHVFEQIKAKHDCLLVVLLLLFLAHFLFDLLSGFDFSWGQVKLFVELPLFGLFFHVNGIDANVFLMMSLINFFLLLVLFLVILYLLIVDFLLVLLRLFQTL